MIRIIKDILIIFFAFLAHFVTAEAQSFTISGTVQENIKKRVDNGLSKSIIVGIIDSTGEQYFSYGILSDETMVKLDENTVYEIGSITKVFTTLLLVLLNEKGQVRIDDTLDKFLPENVGVPEYNNNKITLLHLANHTSGFPRMPGNFNPADRRNPYKDYDEKLLFQFVGNHKLTSAVGEKYLYSNLGMGLLGHLLTKVTGTSFEEMLTAMVFDKLAMSDTKIVISDNMQGRLAKGYSRQQRQVPDWDFQVLEGAGALRSTAKDMLRFIAANVELYKTDLYSVMVRTHKKTMSINHLLSIGMGWHIFDNGNSIIT